MHHLHNYFRKNSVFPAAALRIPHNAGIIAVVPCYDEPGLPAFLESVWASERPEGKVTIIVVVNSPVNVSSEIREQNKVSMLIMEKWAEKNNEEDFFLLPVFVDNIPAKTAGVGYARKTGMDLAAYHFLKSENPGGIIISLDADCSIKQNYFRSIERKFMKNNQMNGACLYFEHPLDGNEFSSKIYSAVMEYELHLRYYTNALRRISFPYAFYTIGSCFAVRASVYAMQGGMNRRKAGEDFYFLQKVIPLGNFSEINDTCVYPSARPSDRVIFGTGAAVRKRLGNPACEYMTYNHRAFLDLGALTEMFPGLYNKPQNTIGEMIENLPEGVRRFLLTSGYPSIIDEVNQNAASEQAFIKRLYTKFNAFTVLKYLNYVHPNIYGHEPLIDAVNGMVGFPARAGVKKMLEYFRDIDRKNTLSV